MSIVTLPTLHQLAVVLDARQKAYLELGERIHIPRVQFAFPSL